MTDEEKAARVAAEQKALDAGKRIKEFIEDPYVKEVFAALEKQILDGFPKADTDEKRRTVWAQHSALTAIAATLRGMVDSGALALHQRTTREAAEDRQRRASTRK